MRDLFTGAASEVVAALARPGPTDRVVLICNYGMQRGIAAAAFASVLAEYDLVANLSGVVGVSSGAPVAAGLIAGCVPAIASVYAGACCTPAFYDRKREARLSIRYIVACLRNKIDAAEVLRHELPLGMQVHLPDSGRSRIVFPGTENRFWEALGATMAAPGLCTEKFYIASESAHDAAAVDPLPLATINTALRPTHVLIITNLPLTGKLWVPLREQGFPRIDGTFRNRVAEALATPEVAVAAAWVPPDFPVGMFTQDRERICSAYDNERARWRTLLTPFVCERSAVGSAAS